MDIFTKLMLQHHLCSVNHLKVVRDTAGKASQREVYFRTVTGQQVKKCKKPFGSHFNIKRPLEGFELEIEKLNACPCCLKGLCKSQEASDPQTGL